MYSFLTVTTAAADQDLTSLAAVKAELDITDTDSDTNLATWITAASNAIAVYCNRVFGRETVVETFRPDRCVRSLNLSRVPVVSITSVVESTTTLTTSDYELDAASGLLLRLDGNDNRSRWPEYKVVVTYVGGYLLLSTLPAAVQQACIELVKSRYHNASRDPLAQRIKVEGVDEVEYYRTSITNDSMPSNVVESLTPFRLYSAS